jgi:catechol 2,3-dioxygenase-like lactoylglutathione lyase family enzyme
MNLNQVTVPVHDIEKSIVFYEKLGLKLIVKSLPDYARFVCDDGNATFSLHRVETQNNTEGVWIYFEIQDLDTFVGSLIEKGIVFDELPDDKPWLWKEARLKDPDNNQIILYFAGENRLDPPWRIK